MHYDITRLYKFSFLACNPQALYRKQFLVQILTHHHTFQQLILQSREYLASNPPHLPLLVLCRFALILWQVNCCKNASNNSLTNIEPEFETEISLATDHDSWTSLYCNRIDLITIEVSKGPHFSFKLVSSHESNAGFGIINLLLEISLIDRLKLHAQDKTIPNQSNSLLIGWFRKPPKS